MCVCASCIHLHNIFHYVYRLTKPNTNLNLTQNNYEFYDYTSFIKDKTYDSEYLDGFHGSEVTYYRILFDMLKSKSILNKITNQNKIKSKLDNRINSLQID